MAEQMTDIQTPHSTSEAFYGERSEREADRLKYMAQIADAVSYRELQDTLSSPHGLVLDVGAGESLELGEQLIAEGHDYLAVDLSESVVRQHLEAGHSAVQSRANQLDVKGDSCSAIHARFAWGWMSDAERSGALHEMLRVGRNTHRGVVIDYDWSVCEGPELFMQSVHDVVSTMELVGFDPAYGAKVRQDLTDKLSSQLEQSVDGNAIVSDEKRVPLFATQSLDIRDAMPTIEMTARAIIDQLQQVGMNDHADRITQNLEKFITYSTLNPTQQVRLPDIVAVHYDIDDKQSQLTQQTLEMLDVAEQAAMQREQTRDTRLEAGVDYIVPFADLPWMAEVGIAESPAAQLAVRQVQTAAYLQNGIIDSSAVGIDGALITSNDPIEYVKRSKYFMTMRDGRLSGVVRMIEPDQSGLPETLPTLSRLSQASPQVANEIVELMSEHGDNPRVCEVSALAKDPTHGKLIDVVRSVIALAYYARKQGYDYGVMGLQESRVRQIIGIFGEESCQRIESEDAIHPIRLPGVQHDIKFVPMIVDSHRFVQQVNEHAKNMIANNPKLERSMFGKIVEMTNAGHVE